MRALDFEVESQRKKERPKRKWKREVEEESVKVGLRREDALCRSKWSVGKSDCCRVELNLATLTCWGYNQISNIGVSLQMKTDQIDARIRVLWLYLRPNRKMCWRVKINHYKI